MDEAPQVDIPVETVEAEAPVDRKDLLSQQFSEVEKDAPVAQRSRDDAGKYLNEAKAKPAAPVAPVVEEPLWKRPPASWKKEYHEAWQTADPRLQEYAHKRESEMHESWKSAASKAEYADTVQKIMEPYMNTVRGLGLDAPQAIKGLIEADHILRSGHPQQKAEYFAQLAQHYGIDIGQARAAAPQGGMDPNLSALANQLNQVRGEVQAWKQNQESQQNQEVMNDIVAFSQKNEHFEAARPTMIALLQSGQADTLEIAYKKALRLDDNLFEATQQASQAQQAAVKRAAADRAAKSARAAAVSVRSSTPGTHTASKAQDRRSLLSEQFNNMNERL